jgi:sorbitol/mannitol transport system permease protein
MLPPVAALLPLNLFAKRVGLLDNIWLLIVLYTSMNLPIAVWMMRSFLNEIPKALPEAASPGW